MKKYSINSLARLSGVTTRTLRHYDQIGLLKPEGKTASGYRLYGQVEVDRLQQILLHKNCGFDLQTIKTILMDPNFDILKALENQEKMVLSENDRLQKLLKTIRLTIKSFKENKSMSDDQKFKGLKNKLVADNDAKYGDEVKKRWGEEAFKKSNDRLKGMTQSQFDQAAKLEKDFKETLKNAFNTGDPRGELAKKAVSLHKQWLLVFWPEYSKEVHMGLAQMYIDDSRFHHYFENNLDLAKFFSEAVQNS